jgi:D-alanine-D-alanine ligase-like ATP-grasp enzyme
MQVPLHHLRGLGSSAAGMDKIAVKWLLLTRFHAGKYVAVNRSQILVESWCFPKLWLLKLKLWNIA